jgi:hypothetical protein
VPAITVQGSRYLFIGIEVSSVNPAGDLVVNGIPSTTNPLLQPADLFYDRCYVHGDPVKGQKRGVGLHASNVGISRSVITDIMRDGQDGQGVYGNNGAGQWLLCDNLIEATGENILFGGDRTFIPNLVPEGISIIGNTIRKPRLWQGTPWDVKNLIEVKTGRHGVMRGNILENTWVANQTGYAVLLTPMNQYGDCPWIDVSDWLIESNLVWNVSSAFNVSGYDSNGFVSQRMQGCTIRNNLTYVDRLVNGGDGRALMVGNGPQGVVVESNTFISNGGSTIYTYVGGAKVAFKDCPGAAFRSNLFRHNAYGFFGDVGLTGAAALERHYPGAPFMDNVIAGGGKFYPPGNLTPTNAEFEAAFMDYAGKDFRLKAGGPWEGRGCDVAKLPAWRVP